MGEAKSGQTRSARLGMRVNGRRAGSDETRGEGREPLVTAVLSVGLALVSTITFVSVALIAAAHIDDRFNVNHVSGTWMGLVQALRSGTFYPPLFEHGFYGGTRWTPLPFLVHGGLSEITGEYILSGKLASLLTAIGLFALVFVALRRLGCSRVLAFSLLAAIVASPPGLLAVTSIRGDTLSTAIQVAAVLVVATSLSKRAVVAAGFLCAAAIAAKLSGVWALVAIAVWLGVHERRRLAPFGAAFVSSVLGMIVVFEISSHGRMLDNLRAFAFTGDGGSPFSSVSTFANLLSAKGGAIWLLFPLAALALVVGFSRRRLTVLHFAFLTEIVVLLVVFRDIGADYNHLIDLAVLTTLVVGELSAQWTAGRADSFAPAALVSLVLIVGIADGYREWIRPDLGQAARELTGRRDDAFPNHPLARYVAAGDSLLSEDPTIPILEGKRPVVLDPFMLQRLQQSHPDWDGRLRARVEAGDFRKIVLIHPISDTTWFARSDIGSSVSSAIRSNYRLLVAVQAPPESYWVYVPRKTRG